MNKDLSSMTAKKRGSVQGGNGDDPYSMTRGDRSTTQQTYTIEKGVNSSSSVQQLVYGDSSNHQASSKIGLQNTPSMVYNSSVHALSSMGKTKMS